MVNKLGSNIGLNRDAHRLLALTSIQRLWRVRSDADARRAIRQWIGDLRRLQ